MSKRSRISPRRSSRLPTKGVWHLSRRAESTRDKLLRSFVSLVLDRGYEQLSVYEVVTLAGVGRSTFYTHFRGLRELLEVSLERPCIGLAASVHLRASPSDLIPLLDHFRAQSRTNSVFFRDPIRSIWSRCLARAIAVAVRGDPSRYQHRPVIPRELLAPVLAELQLAIINRWVTSRPSVSAEAIASALSASTHRLITG